MDPGLRGVLMAISLFFGMVGMAEVGRRVATYRARGDPERVRSGMGVVEGAAFGLLGLILAFTFSGAANRFDLRRQQIVQEANAIGTAWLRLDILAPDDQPQLRETFRSYVDARLTASREVDAHYGQALAAMQRASDLQGEIWRRSRAACERDARTCLLLLSSINEMLDIATSRTMAARTHAPSIVFGLLFAVALLSATLAGYAMAGGTSGPWLHTISFALLTALTTYVIYDLEYPRTGLIRLDAADQALVELRASMH